MRDLYEETISALTKAFEKSKDISYMNSLDDPIDSYIEELNRAYHAVLEGNTSHTPPNLTEAAEEFLNLGANFPDLGDDWRQVAKLCSTISMHRPNTDERDCLVHARTLMATGKYEDAIEILEHSLECLEGEGQSLTNALTECDEQLNLRIIEEARGQAVSLIDKALRCVPKLRSI